MGPSNHFQPNALKICLSVYANFSKQFEELSNIDRIRMIKGSCVKSELSKVETRPFDLLQNLETKSNTGNYIAA
jgi:hypothetical protein